MMKIKTISRTEEDYARKTTFDIAKVFRNRDPIIHPHERAREYQRALIATKLDKIFAKPFVGALDGHKDSVYCLSAVRNKVVPLISGACDGEIKVWDLSQRSSVWSVIGHKGFVRGIAPDATGSTFFSCGDDKVIKRWSLQSTGAGTGSGSDEIDPLSTYLAPHALTAIDHHWVDSQFATSGESVCLWDSNRGGADPVHTYKWGADSVTSIKFNPAESCLLASTASDRSICLYDLRAAVPMRKFFLAMKSNKIVWNPREPMNFVVANEDNHLYSFDMRNLDKALMIHKDHISAVMDVAFCPTGREFVSAGYDRTIRIFGANSARSRDVYHTKRMQRVFCVGFSSDSKFVLSGSDDTNVRIWKAQSSKSLGTAPARRERKERYNDSLKQRFQHMPEIKRITKDVKLPQYIKKANQIQQVQKESQHRKHENRKRHSKPGDVTMEPERQAVIREIGLQSADNNCLLSGFSFASVPVPEIFSISSLSGTVMGGDPVDIVFVRDISGYDSLFCRIGRDAYLSQSIGHNSVLCVTRASVSGVFDIELSVNGVDFISTGYQYEYRDLDPLTDALPLPSFRPKILRIEPSMVASGQSQLVRLYGSNFMYGATCVVGNELNAQVTVTFISTTEVECVLPIHGPGTDVLSIRNPGANVSLPVPIVFTLSASVYINPGDSVYPAFGPLYQPSLITVYGHNLHLVTPKVLCLIGDQWSYSMEMTPSSIRCIASPVTISGRVVVRLANTNREMLPGYASFEYIDDPVIYDAQPLSGYSGAQVIVTGRGFVRMPELTCLFGDQVGNSTLLSDQSIMCTVPSTIVNAGSYEISLQTNGQHVVSSGLTFTLNAMAAIDRLWPTNGPALRGNTIVTVYGSNLLTTIDIYCIFGSSRMPATVISSEYLKCRTPSHIPGRVNVSIMSDGNVLGSSADQLQFVFTADASVDRIAPSFGFTSGDYLVFVYGSNFVNSTALGCAFADMKSRGMFISSTCIACLAPSPIGRPVLKNYAIVPVEVTNNGYDFTNSNVTFNYTEPCSAGSFCLGPSSYLCPNGTYCVENSRNFTLCSPGYFQPLQGQSACILCPVGYICPDYGMSRPVVCPPGGICDVFGLRTSRQSCPAGYYCLNATKASSSSNFQDTNALYDGQTAWITDGSTGVIYFNASVLNYDYTTWPYPAYGKSRRQHPPIDPCDDDSCFTNSLALIAEAPFPCPLGYYCFTGVGTPVPIPKNFSSPQRCFDGYFCPRGSINPEGSGPCPNGYYCPTQVDAVPCPAGQYCPGVGNTAPIECYPGTYNPYEGRANCTVCPTGHICPGWGALYPEPCPAGFVCMELGLSFPVVLCPQGYVCFEGTLTMDPSDPTPLRPYPCQAGVFCLGGVASLITVEWIATQAYGANRPQLCSEGTYCESGAYLSSGSGLCFVGHYCPPNTTFPIATPIGSFAASEGSVAPVLCYPGTYAPLTAQIDCSPCPSGYTCTSYGTYQPTLCAAGTYRAQVDAVVCNSCPTGTYGLESGAPDISICLPCPPTRICGSLGMNNLSSTIACKAGYVCGHATPLANQFTHLVPAGYYTEASTLPENEYDNPCSAGYYCSRGTPSYLQTQAKCAVGSFCPAATSRSDAIDNLCPQLTTSPGGATGIQDCAVSSVDVCDKETIEPYIPFQDVTYYSTFSYILLDGSDTNVTFNSSLGSTATYTGEVQVVRKVMPVNVSSSSSFWVNETVEAFRSCPLYGPRAGRNVVTVIGRNFRNTSSTYCKFRACISSNRGISLRRCKNQITDLSGNSLPVAGIFSNATFITQATYLSTTRMQCAVPPFVFDTIHFNPTFAENYYECSYLTALGEYAVNSTGNMSYIRACDTSSSSSCANLPEDGYEYFTSLTIACSSTDASLGICPDSPDSGYFFNPCISAEVLIEVTNDGDHYSGGDNVNGTSILSTARYGDGTKLYRNYKNFTTNATFAVYTYVASDHYFTNPAMVEMDLALCLQPRYSEEAVRQREVGWFRLHSNEAAHVQVDLSHLIGSPDFVYDQHYRIAIFMIPSRCDINICSSSRIQLQPTEYLPCQYPRSFSNWFINAPTKNIVNNITVYALDDVLFKVEIHILYGVFAPFDHLFENTTTVRIQTPQRTKTFTGLTLKDTRTRKLTPYVSYEQQLIPNQFFFCAVYDLSYTNSIAQSLNMPPTYSDYERGRALLMYNASYSNPNVTLFIDDFNVLSDTNFWNQPATTVEESKEMLDAYFETFQQTTYDPSTGYTFNTEELLLPYLPYFSNCYTFDSYIPLWLLFEGQECELPDTYPTYWYRYKYPALVDQDDIKVVGPFSIFEYPVADWCERNLTCNYEEQLTSQTSSPRWFEQATSTSLFQILRYPVDYFSFTGRQDTARPTVNDDGGGTIIDYYTAQSTDNFIAVTYDHTAGDAISGCTLQCFGRQYTLEVTYYQVTPYDKQIITATLTGAGYDFNTSNTEYQLLVSYYALGWFDLILNFAFDISIFCVLFVGIGLSLWLLSGIIWLLNRVTTHLEHPPEFRFLSLYLLHLPPVVAGVVLAIIPIWILTAFGNYIIFGYFITDPNSPQAADVGLLLDSWPNTYNNLGYVVSEATALSNRDGRVGTMFCIIGFCCFVTASKLYFPKPETNREREIAKLRTPMAHAVKSWQPVLWKKANFIFISYCLSLLLTLLVECSLWSAFSNYQFLIMTILAIFGAFFDNLFSVQMQDELLAAPLNTAYGFAAQFVTFGANNFLQFILSYVYGVGMAFFSRLYLDTYVDAMSFVADWVLEQLVQIFLYLVPRYWYQRSSVIRKFLKSRESTRTRRRDVEKELNKPVADSSNGAGSAKETADASPFSPSSSPGDSVEPVIMAYSSLCNDMVILFYFPYFVYLLMQYRTPTQIPASYGILQSDMVIYLFFQLFMLVFEPLFGVMNIATWELYAGWKCYDYLIYCRYRFTQREERWKGCENHVDESIEESIRQLDQMCFSSQYFFMLTIMFNGILYHVLAYECWLRASYSPFSDSAFVLFTIILVCMWIVVENACYYLGMVFNVWRIQHENTAWHIQYKDEDVALPTWNDIQGASHDGFLMNQRITHDTFRYKFLAHNKTWLIQQLPQVLSPRTLRRSRPALIHQLFRVINENQHEISDESDADLPRHHAFKIGPLSDTSKVMIRWWLTKARRRMKLKKVVEPLIRKARGVECKQCLSKKQLQVEYRVDIDRMAQMYDAEYPGDDQVDPMQWKNFWIKHQGYRTLCLSCLNQRRASDTSSSSASANDAPIRRVRASSVGLLPAATAASAAASGLPALMYGAGKHREGRGASSDDTDEDGHPTTGFGPVQLTSVSKAIMLNWYHQAQRRRIERTTKRRKNRKHDDISDDEGEAMSHPWAQELLHLTPSTTAIAMKWLKTARQSVRRGVRGDVSGGSGGAASSELGTINSMIAASSPTPMSPTATGSEMAAIRAEGFMPGMRSKYLRK